MARRRPLVAAAALLALVPAGLAARAQAPSADIDLIDNAFEPGFVRVEPGTTITWRNEGRTLHDVRADDGSWASGDLEPGGSFSRVFGEPGVVAFHCSYHGAPGAGMAGLAIVGDAPLPAPVGGVGPGLETPPPGPAGTVRVPEDATTIQGAVDLAEPGGLVLIAPAVYREAVVVRTPFLTIRGLDRNRTVLDGGFELATGIHVIEADGVAVENLTARHFVLNGFQWTSVNGYRGSHLTAYANGDYGVFAYDSRYGLIERSYASGHPDSGFYVGQCQPCDAVIADVVAEGNAIGYSGTNAGGDLYIVNGEWRGNLAGIVPNTLDSEELPPQRGVTIAGNHVHDNNAIGAPSTALTYPSYGIGILVAGGRDDRIVGNLVEDHATYGIALLPNLDRNVWVTGGNAVRGNVVRRSGLADLALGAPSAGGDCFAGNDASTSSPPAIELLLPCSGPRLGWGGDPAPTVTALIRFLDAIDGAFPRGDWRTQPTPPDQPGMARPGAAPPFPALPSQFQPLQIPAFRDPRSIAEAPGPRVSKEATVLGVPIATSWWALLVGLYGYVFPVVLLATWMSVSLWDLARRESETVSVRARWMAAVLLLPFLGPILYLWRGGSAIPRPLRVMLVAGGLVAYAIVATVGAVVGG